MAGMRAIPLAAILTVLLAAACAGGDDAAPSATQQLLIVDGSVTTTSAAARTSPPPQVTVTDTPEPTVTPEPVLVSLDWLPSVVDLPDVGAIAARSQDAGLQSAIASALLGFETHASVSVRNLADGRSATVDESRSWYAASTFKAAILLAAYQQRDAGVLDFGKIVTVEPKYAENDLGTLEYLGIRPNDLITIGDAIKGMIVVSDTSLAGLVQDQVGGNAVDAALRDVGATVMTVNSRELPTTAADLTQLMIAIASAHGVSGESRDEMLSLLSQEWFTSGVVAGLPGGTQYAHKSGNLGEATHDAAIVWAPGGPYVIVVMTDGSGGWEPIATVSAAVWAYFAGGA
jgi:beta-lactamase class A